MNGPIAEMDEESAPEVPSQVLDSQKSGLQPSLDCGVAKIVGGVLVLHVVRDRREVKRFVDALLEMLPGIDELFVQAVELVGLSMHILQPVPLDDGCFQQGGRRVGVVFEQLGRANAVVGEIESAVKREFVLVPAVANEIDPVAAD